MKIRIRQSAALCGALLLSAALVFPSAADSRFSMTYLYTGAPSSYAQLINQTGGAFGEVSPNYFNLHSDGSLDLNDLGISSFVSEMHRQGVTVVPFLSNHWDREKGVRALENRERLAQEIADAVQRYDLDGIHVDIENVTHLHRDAYTDFVRLLRQKIPQEKVVAVAVAANPYGITQGWHGSYDYAGLGQWADYLMLMTYDEHYQGGPAGPVASQSFVEKSIRYALRYVSSDQVVLGLPFFGRIWGEGNSTIKGRGITELQIQSMMANYPCQVERDEESGSAKVTLTVGPLDQKPVLGGSLLPAGTYTIWYEDQEAKKQRLSLVEEYDLLGAGSWCLGQESTDTWDYYALWLNGRPFADVQGHWAMHYVLSAALDGVMAGKSDVSFAPEALVTRGEAAVVLCRLMGLEPSNQATPFRDVAGHWAEGYISAAWSARLVAGVSSELYDPDRPVTRAEVSAMLSWVHAQDESAQTPVAFPDVPKSHWAYEAIQRLSALGIISGYPDGTFRPNASVTRAELACMVTG